MFEGQEFRRFLDRDSGATFSDLEFRNCKFVSSAISITERPERRTTIRNVNVIDCAVQACELRAAILDTVLVDGLKTSGAHFARGAAYRHVTLRGRIGSVVLGEYVPPVRESDARRAALARSFAEANARFYAAGDWALDLTEVSCQELSVHGVPAALIRRDPKTQCVVKRERLQDGKWSTLGLTTVVQILLGELATATWPDMVIVAPKRSRSFAAVMEEIARLRDAGIAEPD